MGLKEEGSRLKFYTSGPFVERDHGLKPVKQSEPWACNPWTITRYLFNSGPLGNLVFQDPFSSLVKYY